MKKVLNKLKNLFKGRNAINVSFDVVCWCGSDVDHSHISDYSKLSMKEYVTCKKCKKIIIFVHKIN